MQSSALLVLPALAIVTTKCGSHKIKSSVHCTVVVTECGWHFVIKPVTENTGAISVIRIFCAVVSSVNYRLVLHQCLVNHSFNQFISFVCAVIILLQSVSSASVLPPARYALAISTAL
jgi:hypothetical protein